MEIKETVSIVVPVHNCENIFSVKSVLDGTYLMSESPTVSECIESQIK